MCIRICCWKFKKDEVELVGEVERIEAASTKKGGLIITVDEPKDSLPAQAFMREESSINRISLAAERSLSSAKSLHAKQNPQILVAEDSVINQKLMKQKLMRLFHLEDRDVVLAADGQEALLLATARKFHLIITDWEMPPPDGIALAKILHGKENRKGLNAETPIVGWSSCLSPHTAEQLEEYGIVEWIPKEISNEDLVQLGRKYLP